MATWLPKTAIKSHVMLAWFRAAIQHNIPPIMQPIALKIWLIYACCSPKKIFWQPTEKMLIANKMEKHIPAALISGKSEGSLTFNRVSQGVLAAMIRSAPPIPILSRVNMARPPVMTSCSSYWDRMAVWATRLVKAFPMPRSRKLQTATNLEIVIQIPNRSTPKYGLVKLTLIIISIKPRARLNALATPESTAFR